MKCGNCHPGRRVREGSDDIDAKPPKWPNRFPQLKVDTTDHHLHAEPAKLELGAPDANNLKHRKLARDNRGLEGVILNSRG